MFPSVQAKHLCYGPVVQLVRTLACHARGQGFESPSGRQYADLAHLVERNLAKVEVAGSSPVIRSKKKKTPLAVFFLFVTMTLDENPYASAMLTSDLHTQTSILH